MKLVKFALSLLSFALLAQAHAATITGAGATFPQPIYAKWSADYQKATGNQVNYQGIGSSGGIKQINAKTVDFGATDAPLTKSELDAGNLIQFPTVIGGVVPVVNIPGVGAGQLKLDGDTLAKIYLGTISTWNDPAIQKLNPTLSLPATKITTVNRSDGSGTTYVFTSYLSDVSSVWKSQVGAEKSIKWPNPSSSVGGKGNEGVASTVKRVAGSIGYVEYAFAKQSKMAYVSLKNKAGKYIQPDDTTFAAAANIDWSKQAGFGASIVNTPAPNAWPISSATFILVPKNGGEKSQEAIKFFDWAFTNGNASVVALDYAVLPANVKAAIKNEWKKVQ